MTVLIAYCLAQSSTRLYLYSKERMDGVIAILWVLMGVAYAFLGKWY